MYRSRLQYLLLEVADGILVSVCKEIEDAVFDVVLLQVVHQVGTIALIFKNTVLFMSTRDEFFFQQFIAREIILKTGIVG